MTTKQKVILWAGIGIVLLGTTVFCTLPIRAHLQKMRNLRENFKGAETVCAALKRYAEAHGNMYPESLDALVPSYLESETLLWNTVADGKKTRWHYFAEWESEKRVHIVFGSFPNSEGDYVFGYSDFSARIEFKYRNHAEDGGNRL